MLGPFLQSQEFLSCTTKLFNEVRRDTVLIRKNCIVYCTRVMKPTGVRYLKGSHHSCASTWATPFVLVYFRIQSMGHPLYGLFKINCLLLAGIRYFTFLDIENSYFNMPTKDGNNYKNGFLTPFGSWICEKYYIWIIILTWYILYKWWAQCL